MNIWEKSLASFEVFSFEVSVLDMRGSALCFEERVSVDRVVSLKFVAFGYVFQDVLGMNFDLEGAEGASKSVGDDGVTNDPLRFFFPVSKIPDSKQCLSCGNNGNVVAVLALKFVKELGLL